MGAGTIDKAKGRLKEAAGALADDPKLKREGKLDQVAGRVKDGVERVKEGVEEAVDTVRDKFSGEKGAC